MWNATSSSVSFLPLVASGHGELETWWLEFSVSKVAFWCSSPGTSPAMWRAHVPSLGMADAALDVTAWGFSAVPSMGNIVKLQVALTGLSARGAGMRMGRIGPVAAVGLESWLTVLPLLYRDRMYPGICLLFLCILPKTRIFHSLLIGYCEHKYLNSYFIPRLCRSKGSQTRSIICLSWHTRFHFWAAGCSWKSRLPSIWQVTGLDQSPGLHSQQSPFGVTGSSPHMKFFLHNPYN